MASCPFSIYSFLLSGTTVELPDDFILAVLVFLLGCFFALCDDVEVYVVVLEPLTLDVCADATPATARKNIVEKIIFFIAMHFA